MTEYVNCELCARRCGANRENGALGYCGMTDKPVVSLYDLHRWEEPIISGTKGSGAIFFCGCSLGCVFCQNAKISRAQVGTAVSEERLADIMLELQGRGAHNVNLVTATHFVPSVRSAIQIARARGLKVPIVYNTGSYDTSDAIRSLAGFVDVYLPDLKYYTEKTAEKYSNAHDYFKVATEAISEMYRQVGAPVIEDGIIKRGVIVRILLLPGHVAEAKLALKYLYTTYADGIYISLMSQYTPMPDMKRPLDRRVTKEEYRQLTEYAISLGVKNAFIQDTDSASSNYIPNF